MAFSKINTNQHRVTYGTETVGCYSHLLVYKLYPTRIAVHAFIWFMDARYRTP
jgi:hypothetical protein